MVFCRVFESESEFMSYLGMANHIFNDLWDYKKLVFVIRNQGHKGGPGMLEMLKPTSAIVGMGIKDDVAFITDGRFSGGSHGFIIGHVYPEAYVGCPISKVKNGDRIIIDSNNNTINWIKKDIENHNGYLEKYIKQVQCAETGCITI